MAIRQIADTCILAHRWIECGEIASRSHRLQSTGVHLELLSKPQLTSEEEEIEISAEMAEANAQEIVSHAAEGSVLALGGQSYHPRSRLLRRSKRAGHCRSCSALCFKCKQ